jgi:hypothetical protein
MSEWRFLEGGECAASVGRVPVACATPGCGRFGSRGAGVRGTAPGAVTSPATAGAAADGTDGRFAAFDARVGGGGAGGL